MDAAPKTLTKLNLFLREKRLISLLKLLGESVPSADFQALLYLQNHQSKKHGKSSINSAYDFVPSAEGPYSFTSFHDRSRLENRGILEPQTSDWQLTPFGSQIAHTFPETESTANLPRYVLLRGEALFAEIGKRQPHYFIKKAPSKSTNEASNHPSTHGVGSLYTIGYERRSLEEFLNLLIENQIDVLCDVRRNAVSRRFGFSKKALVSSCRKIGIDYQHLPSLGIESTSRRGLHTQAERESLFAAYANQTSAPKKQAVDEIKSELMMDKRVALTCYERDVTDCHRGVLASQLIKDVLSDLKANDQITYRCNLTHL